MEETETNRLRTRDIILRFGLLGGGLGILITAALYLIDAKLLFSFWGFMVFGAILAVGIVAAAFRRSNNGGYISYGDAVVTSIASFSIGQTLYTLFLILLYFVIDPSLVEKSKEVAMEWLDKSMANGNIDKARYTASQAAIESMNGNTILFRDLMGLIIVIIVSLVIYLISSIFIKKETPFQSDRA